MSNSVVVGHHFTKYKDIGWCVSGEEGTNQLTIPTMNSR